MTGGRTGETPCRWAILERRLDMLTLTKEEIDLILDLKISLADYERNKDAYDTLYSKLVDELEKEEK